MALVLCCDGIAHLASRIASVNSPAASSTVLGCDPAEAIHYYDLSLNRHMIVLPQLSSEVLLQIMESYYTICRA